MPEMGMEKWTVKVVSKRDPAANTEENKDRRIQVVKELNKWRQDERVIVYIDETHFDFRKIAELGKRESSRKRKSFMYWKAQFCVNECYYFHY